NHKECILICAKPRGNRTLSAACPCRLDGAGQQGESEAGQRQKRDDRGRRCADAEKRAKDKQQQGGPGCEAQPGHRKRLSPSPAREGYQGD
ncbi:hypothetical protein NL526_27730, partial [Klebsiella pneumoniae]|nr:hypothetical protein [Klebsiella pneumoniae]